MYRRPSPPVVTPRLATALTLLVLTVPTAADAAPRGAAPRAAVIERIERLDSPPGVRLEITLDRALEWTVGRDREGRLAIELPNARPGHGVVSRLYPGGLVSEIRLASVGVPSRPVTRLVVVTRGPADHRFAVDGSRLRLELVPTGLAFPAPPAPLPAPAPTPALRLEPAAIPPPATIESAPPAPRPPVAPVAEVELLPVGPAPAPAPLPIVAAERVAPLVVEEAAPARPTEPAPRPVFEAEDLVTPLPVEPIAMPPEATAPPPTSAPTPPLAERAISPLPAAAAAHPAELPAPPAAPLRLVVDTPPSPPTTAPPVAADVALLPVDPAPAPAPIPLPAAERFAALVVEQIVPPDVEELAPPIVEAADTPVVEELVPPAVPEPLPPDATPRPAPPLREVATELSTIVRLAAGVLALAGDGPFDYTGFRLERPERFVLDLHGVLNRSPLGMLAIDEGDLLRVRVSQYRVEPTPVTRVIFDLRAPTLPAIEPAADGLLVRFPADGPRTGAPPG
jgi:hypothetical protein